MSFGRRMAQRACDRSKARSFRVAEHFLFRCSADLKVCRGAGLKACATRRRAASERQPNRSYAPARLAAELRLGFQTAAFRSRDDADADGELVLPATEHHTAHGTHVSVIASPGERDM